jgi:signal transduction histidine kinase/CheY-like chemotaxis protein
MSPRHSRSLRAWLAIGLGAAANAAAAGVPGSVPLLLGVVVPTRFANRRQPGWALRAGALVGLASASPALAGYCLVLALVSVLLAGRSLPERLMLMPLLALPVAALVLWLQPPLASWPLGLALLTLNGLLAQFASHLLFDLPEAAGPQRLPALRSLLTSRFTTTLAPALFAGLLLVGQWHWTGLARDQANATARGNAHMIEYVEEHVGEHLRAVAQAADDASAAAQRPGLVGLRQRLQGFLTLLVTDANGHLTDFHAPGVKASPGPVADRDYFLQPRASGQPYVSGAFRGRGFGTDLLVAVSAPYFDAAGRFAGVVEGSLSLSRMQQRLQAMATDGALELVLRDAAGSVVISTLETGGHPLAEDDSRLRPASDGRFLPLNASRDHLLVERPLPTLGWQLATLSPLAPLAGQQTLGHLLLGLACLTGLALIHWLSSRFVLGLSGPLDQLLGHIRAIDLEHPASLQPLTLEVGFAELAELRRDFNAMLARLAELDQRLRDALQAQAELNRELEQRVTRRTEDLREALARARQLAEAKSTFLANMSHELRTPLTSILGYAELGMATEAASPARDEALQTIRRQGEHLLAVVNDVLDAGRVESGSLRVEVAAVGIDALLRDLRDAFGDRARAGGLQLRMRVDPGMPPAVIGDPLRLRQVLINLLGNALKFTPQGWVELRLRRCLSVLVFSVRDSGVGLDAQARARLFQPFSQADLSTTRRFGGSGLGLFISRRLCEAMGGRLSVHARPGKGSRFTVVFPATLAAAGAATEPGPATSSAPPRLRGRVLVADDVEDLRRLVVALVRATGAEVRDCGNGEEALQLAERWAPDLLLMDMHMPVMDGMQATRLLRQRGLRAPVVALTADVLAEDRRRFLDAGCDEVLHKPIHREALHRLLQQHLPAATGVADMAGFPAALAELRLRYARRLGTEMQELEDLHENAEHQPLLEKLHTLKGSAGTFGFAEVSQAAAALEAALRAADSEPGAEAAAWRALQVALQSALVPVGEDGGGAAGNGTLAP